MMKYEPNKIIIKPIHIVDGLLPKGETLVFGKSGIGKSLLFYWLAICLKYNIDFLGMKTIKGIDILIINEDNAHESFISTLDKMENSVKDKKTHGEIYIHSMEGLRVKDGSLLEEIKKELEEHPNIGLILMDSIHAICGNMKVNDTVEMSKFTEFKSRILEIKPSLSLVCIHHATQHQTITYADFMEDKIEVEAMGNSRITQDADSIIIMIKKEELNGKLISLGIRVKPKRFILDAGMFTINLIQSDKKMRFEYGEKYIRKEPEIVNDVIKYFKSNSSNKKKQYSYVEEVVKDFHGLYKDPQIRETLKGLELDGYLTLSRSASNKYKYSLTTKGRLWGGVCYTHTHYKTKKL
jgi:hypothetical protein